MKKEGTLIPGLKGAARPVKSAVRAMELMELFATERRPLSQREIIEQLHYPQSSTNFLLRSLIQTGYVIYLRERRLYFPTPRIYRTGAWLAQTEYAAVLQDGVISDLMHDMLAATSGTISVAMQSDIYVQWLRVLDSRQSMHWLTEGSMMPLTYSAYGWMLLSFLPDTQAEKLCRLINAKETNRSTRINVTQVAAQLDLIRTRQYCYRTNLHIKNGGSVVMQLPMRLLGSNIVIGVGAHVARLENEEKKIVTAMRAVIQRHSARMRGA